ncbi:MAG TPA: hypothetical protein VK203_24285 [Nostocaceae cyanobacterium]|nr:hypothetical protein [Nostocaceae cyanobacterium]
MLALSQVDAPLFPTQEHLWRLFPINRPFLQSVYPDHLTNWLWSMELTLKLATF